MPSYPHYSSEVINISSSDHEATIGIFAFKNNLKRRETHALLRVTKDGKLYLRNADDIHAHERFVI